MWKLKAKKKKQLTIWKKISLIKLNLRIKNQILKIKDKRLKKSWSRNSFWDVTLNVVVLSFDLNH